MWGGIGCGSVIAVDSFTRLAARRLRAEILARWFRRFATDNHPRRRPLRAGYTTSMTVAPTLAVFGTIVVLLGVFVLAAMLLARSRRRLDEPPAPPQRPVVDAWREAGRRVSPGRGPHEDGAGGGG